MTRSVDSGVIFFARLLLAVLFLWGGAMKLMGYGEFVGYLKGLGVPFTQVAAPVIVALEAIGGVLLIVGYQVKPLALVLALYTLAAALIGHNFWDADQFGSAARHGRAFLEERRDRGRLPAAVRDGRGRREHRRRAAALVILRIAALSASRHARRARRAA